MMEPFHPLAQYLNGNHGLGLWLMEVLGLFRRPRAVANSKYEIDINCVEGRLFHECGSASNIGINRIVKSSDNKQFHQDSGEKLCVQMPSHLQEKAATVFQTNENDQRVLMAGLLIRRACRKLLGIENDHEVEKVFNQALPTCRNVKFPRSSDGGCIRWSASAIAWSIKATMRPTKKLKSAKRCGENFVKRLQIISE